MVVLLAAFARADTLWIGETVSKAIKADNVKITSIEGDKLFYTTDLSMKTSKQLSQLVQINIDGETATGTWRFEDTVIATEHRVVVAGAAFYQDRYARGADGQWRIAHTGYVRTYEAMMSLDDLPSFKFTA